MFHCNPWRGSYAFAGYSSRASRACNLDAPHTYESRRGRRGTMGVRRPLRYLSYHLDLDEEQRRQVAASFDRVKLERAQADVDHKRSRNKLADEIISDAVSVDQIRNILTERVEADAKMHTVVAKELFEIARVLDPEQRDEFAHLIRTGIVQL